MGKKIAFFDIDGTLINVPHGIMKPTQTVQKALKTFQAKGNYIVIATARGSNLENMRDIPFDGYICNDGHYIAFRNEVFVDDKLSTQQIKKLEDVFKRNNGQAMYYGNQGEWCRCLDHELVKKHQEMFSGTTKKPQGVYEEFTAEDVQAKSCCVLFEIVEQLQAAYHELKDELTMIPYKTGLIRMDIYNKGFTKGTACEYLYKKLDIDYEDTYAFGDGVNDKEMFEFVCHAQAMGNAVEELKAIATEVIESVDHDGVAQYLNQYLNQL